MPGNVTYQDDDGNFYEGPHQWVKFADRDYAVRSIEEPYRQIHQEQSITGTTHAHPIDMPGYVTVVFRIVNHEDPSTGEHYVGTE